MQAIEKRTVYHYSGVNYDSDAEAKLARWLDVNSEQLDVVDGTTRGSAQWGRIEAHLAPADLFFAYAKLFVANCIAQNLLYTQPQPQEAGE